MSNEITTYQPKQRNPMVIKNLCPGLMEMGKIKIGNKGAVRQAGSGKSWQAPQKLDHFLITTMQRGDDNNFILDDGLHKLFGEAPKSIPVRLIYDDISLNFATRYICYYGKTVFCSGDGEEAQRLQPDKKTYATRSCPCERQDPAFAGDVVNGQVKAGQGKCKINGILSVIIDGAQCVGGVWKFRTTSYNSVVGILSSLALIQRITGGRLGGIPMNMTVTPKTVQDPIQGSQQTIYVVGLQYAGTMDSLRDTGYQIAMIEAKHGISMARIEEDARLMLAHTPAAGLGDDLSGDVIEEFYPEEARAAGGVGESPALVDPVTVAAQSGDETPALVDPIVDAVIETEIVDEQTGEVTEAPQQQSEKQKPAKQQRGTKKNQAVEQAEVTQQTATDFNDDGFPDPPGTVKAQEEPPHPADESVATEPSVTEEEPMGDLF